MATRRLAEVRSAFFVLQDDLIIMAERTPRSKISLSSDLSIEKCYYMVSDKKLE